MHKVSELFNHKKYEGDLGIEIEIEGDNLPRIVKGWRCEDDGSLRGESCEYVTSTPLKIDTIDLTIDELKKSFYKKGGTINESVRAGVHVHVNIQEMDILQVGCFATMFYMLEDILIRFCGQYREGNLFCLRTSDADYGLYYVIDSFNKKNHNRLNNDKIRYSAINWKPFTTYGSIEFRSMRTPSNLDLVSLWAKILLKVLEKSMFYNHPRDIIAAMSMNTPQEFLKETLDEYYYSLSFEGESEYLMKGMENAQDFAFLINWEDQVEYFEKKLKVVYDEFDEVEVWPINPINEIEEKVFDIDID